VILELDDAADFLRLVTGNAVPAVDFLTGALRVRGDERFALELAGFFKVPSGDNGGGTVKLDPTAVDAELIARVVKTVPGDQLRERLAGGLRVEVLDEVFRRFPEYLHASKTRGMDAVVKFKIGGRSDGNADRYVVVIADGTCRAGSGIDAEPGVTIVVDAADFLKLVTGNLNPLTAFLRGRLKVKGDLVLAAQLPGLFAIPSAS
jgi:putative sterol carrier protein